MLSYNLFPDWLQTLDFRKSGVGSNKDLWPNLMAGEGSKWMLFINAGWYYLNNNESYYYRAEGTTTGSGVIESPGISFFPSRGPILVSRDNVPLVRTFPNLKAAQSPTWVNVSGDLYRSTVDVNDDLLNVRGLYRETLSSVPATGNLDFGNTYYYDGSSRNVYVKSESSPASSIYIDIFEEEASDLIDEVLYPDKDGYVYPTYPIYTNLLLSKGTASQAVTGTASGAVQCTIAPTLSWVKASYTVPDSWFLTNHKTIYTNATGTVDVSYETSIDYLLPPIRVANDPASGLFNLNPLLKDAPSQGYLFLASSATGVATNFIDITSSVSAHKTADEQVIKLKITTLNDQRSPNPWQTLDLVTITGHSSIVAQFPEDDRTDAAGNKFLYLTGSAAIGVTAVCGVATGTFTVGLEDPLTPTEYEYTDGTLSLVTTPTAYLPGYLQSYTAVYTLDGIPKSTSEYSVVKAIGNTSFVYKDSNGSQLRSLQRVPNISQTLGGGNILGTSNPFGIEQTNQAAVLAIFANKTSKIISKRDESVW